MKVAKASENDLDVAMTFVCAMDSLSGFIPRVPEAIARTEDEDEDDGEHFDRDSREQCVRVLGHLLDLAERASLMRVVMGCAVMLDPRNQCVDPDADTIEHHPNTKAGLEARKPRALADWSAKDGAVVWWSFSADDRPWLGTPDDPAWPGKHTHWTPLITPDPPAPV